MMSNDLSQKLTPLRRDERGQIAILMLLVLPVIFLLFALALDAGVWFLDHRIAQNQVDAAVLAAIRYLPAEPGSDGYINTQNAVNTWLVKNGSGPEELCEDAADPYPQFSDTIPTAGDGRYDFLRVCVQRQSSGIFSGLAGINFITVSAVASARIGPVGGANVMPWALVPSETTCSTPGELCKTDYDGDGDLEPCGFFPPAPVGDPLGLCPWGMDDDKLWVFKESTFLTPGNFSPIQACGIGAFQYQKCIEGSEVSGFYEEGETVQVGTQTGNIGIVTKLGLDARYDAREGVDGDGNYECDIKSTPDLITGLDPDGKARAKATFAPGFSVDQGPETYNYRSPCEYRLIAVPIIDHFPPGGASEDVLVIGVATFGIAGWDRTPVYGDDRGTPTQPCAPPPPGPPQPPDTYYTCGMVWGYFIGDVQPPEVLLTQITDSGNPFAPLAMALIE